MYLFLEIIAFIYFSLKNYLLYKYLKLFKNTKLNHIISLTVSISYLFLERHLTAEYGRYLDFTFIKGAIELPPFIILLIAGDIISTLIVIFIIKKQGISESSLARIFYEFGRFIILFASFYYLVSTFWFSSFNKKLANFDYTCFKFSLAKDLAVYYLAHGVFPKDLKTATKYTINPVNNAPLISFNEKDVLSYKVVDSKGNIIIEGYKDYIGIAISRDRPEEYLKGLEIMTDNLCRKN